MFEQPATPRPTLRRPVLHSVMLVGLLGAAFFSGRASGAPSAGLAVQASSTFPFLRSVLGVTQVQHAQYLGERSSAIQALKPAALNAHMKALRNPEGWTRGGPVHMTASAVGEHFAQREQRARTPTMGEEYSTVYSTETKKESYDTLDMLLEKKVADANLRSVLTDLFKTFGLITETLRTQKQMGVDVLADNFLWDVAKGNQLVKEAASELSGAYSSGRVRQTNPITGKYSLIWDPLDGGARGSDGAQAGKSTHAIVDNNWAVGSIVGIYPASKGIIGSTGRDQVGTVIALYGPRTTVFVTLDDGVYEFTYGCFSEEVCVMDAQGDPAWICSRERIQIAPEASIFSAANLRATQDLPQYQELVDYWGKNAYSLRYTGAIVSDICQQFTKKQGVFANPASPKSPAKLPLAYAALPFAHMVEKAGGKSSDGMTGGSILDVKIEALDQRTAMCIGSANEVERFNDIVLRDGPSAQMTEASEQYFPDQKTLETVLEKKLADKDLRSLYYTMFNAFGTITEALRNELVTVADNQNSQFGDIQLGVDVLADDLMWDVCKADPLVKDAASEEEPEVREMHADGKYSIVWDPLDGSSIIDNNWAVGTIIGIWPASTGIIGATGRDQVSSMVALYGPRTTAYVTLDDGVYEFTYGEDGWFCSKERLKIETESEIFSWGNVKAAQGGTTYGDLVNYWMENRYTLRVSGGLVPDICQQFTKGRGVFAYPATENAPAKLRLAFEAAPFANLVEKSGGKSSDGVTGGSILDVEITGIDQRSPLCMGSSTEVDRFNKMVLGK